jgi:hypothetical protein
MYNNINLLAEVQTRAEEFIINNDRMLYKPFLVECEKFCQSAGIIIGGTFGVDLLTSRKLNKGSFYWELYCNDTFNNAKRITDAIAQTKSPHINLDTIEMRTDIKHREFTIYVYGRALCKVYQLGQMRNMDLIKLMIPTICKSVFTDSNVKCLSEEMQLMDIYRALYSPGRFSEWEYSIAAESSLYELFCKNYPVKVGGGTPKDKISTKILSHIITGADIVLVGDYALREYKIKNSSNRIQILSSEDPVSLASKIGKAIGAHVSYTKHTINIPRDFQTEKYTYYTSSQIPILDQYTSPAFELIPYTVNARDIKIANPWVLLRFEYINLWVLRLIDAMSGKTSKTKILNIMANISNLRAATMDILRNDPVKLFQLDNYIGQFIKERVAKKKILSSGMPSYFPCRDKITESTKNN